MATEEIAYKTLQADGNIEIRAYEETVRAEVTVNADREDASGKAFRTLFNYIQGANTGKHAQAEQIPMTAPVSQQSATKQTAQKIPMTAPVSQEKAYNNADTAEDRWTVAFYMPGDMTYDQTPTPRNEMIAIKRIPARTMASITFNGRNTNDNVYEHEQKLRDYLLENDIAFQDPPLYAFYDSPMTPWFMRRNEVLFEIEAAE